MPLITFTPEKPSTSQYTPEQIAKFADALRSASGATKDKMDVDITIASRALKNGNTFKIDVAEGGNTLKGDNIITPENINHVSDLINAAAKAAQEYGGTPHDSAKIITTDLRVQLPYATAKKPETTVATR